MKNNGISSFYETEVEEGFFVLRLKNDSEVVLRKKHPVSQEFIQFHFCLKGQTNFTFNEGSYTFQVREDHSMLLYNPQKALPIEVELAPDTWMVSVLISITKFHVIIFFRCKSYFILKSREQNKKVL